MVFFTPPMVLGRKVPAVSSFTPADLGSALKAWYSADSGVYVDAGSTLATNGQTVAQWNDKSGNNYHLSQTTSGARPTYQSGGFNSNKTVLFVAATPTWMSTYLLASSEIVAMGTGTAGSCFFVGQMLTGTTSNGRAISYIGNGLSGDTASAACTAWQLRNGSSNQIAAYRSGFKAVENISLATNVRIGNIYDGANDTIYINNVAGTPVADSDAWTSPGTITLSSENRNSGSPAAPWDGPLSEIVITNTALSGTERTNLDNYFKTKWGL